MLRLCRGQHPRTARLQGGDHCPQWRAALPLGFALVANAHDFGTYRTLWLVSAELPLPDDARAWLDDLVEPSTWIAVGFPQPVTYEGSRAVMRPFREVIAAALQITRANADGSFFPAENAVLHRNLLAAYGLATVAAADSG